MKRSAALVLLGVVVSSVGLLCATSKGRGLLAAVAADQIDSVLDTIAVTPKQRRALEEMKNVVSAELHARVEQLHNLLRCAVNSRARPKERFVHSLPPINPRSDFRNATQLIRAWNAATCRSNSYLPAPRGAFASEWRSCWSFAPR